MTLLCITSLFTCVGRMQPYRVSHGELSAASFHLPASSFSLWLHSTKCRNKDPLIPCNPPLVPHPQQCIDYSDRRTSSPLSISLPSACCLENSWEELLWIWHTIVQIYVGGKKKGFDLERSSRLWLNDIVDNSSFWILFCSRCWSCSAQFHILKCPFCWKYRDLWFIHPW